MGDDTAGGSDIIHGWMMGGGWMTTQADLAISFYENVTGSSIFDNGDASNVTVTGHSFGGGLAGWDRHFVRTMC